MVKFKVLEHFLVLGFNEKIQLKFQIMSLFTCINPYEYGCLYVLQNLALNRHLTSKFKSL